MQKMGWIPYTMILGSGNVIFVPQMENDFLIIGKWHDVFRERNIDREKSIEHQRACI